MDIIFTRLHRFQVLAARLVQMLGHRVFYLKLSEEDNSKITEMWAESLRSYEILPLPLEDIQNHYDFSEIYFDNEGQVSKTTRRMASREFLQGFETLFPGIKHIEHKLLNILHQTVAIEMMETTGKINLWACENSERTLLVIDTEASTLFSPELAPNVRLLVLPVSIFTNSVRAFFSLISSCFTSLDRRNLKKINNSAQRKIHGQNKKNFHIAYIPHKGLDYGKLYRKDLFYSDSPDSALFPEKLLHIDYSGYTNPSEKLTWVCMGEHRGSWRLNLTSACKIFQKGFFRIRSFRQILGFILLARSYMIYRSFLAKLEEYPNLKLALIDYEVLCPKELLLALESRGIRTIAAQERFILSFERMWVSIFLDYYYCTSDFAAEAMKKSFLNCIRTYIPVGQYRSDNLIKSKDVEPPKILKTPIEKGCRIITALGFHTHGEWYKSQLDPALNWKAHRQFLEDMLHLSRDLENVFIILRYKNTSWISLPVFSDLIEAIDISENIQISIEYEKFNYSYDLCAHSDLVIAKHTSIADECLAVGIPVLLHEYTHNTNRLMADSFDYSPTRIMCFNYEELLKRTKTILKGTPNPMSKDYEYLKSVVYGGFGDGNVRKRIQLHLDALLSEIKSGNLNNYTK